MALSIYLISGFILLTTLLNEKWVYEMDILDSSINRFIFIWAWPAFLSVIILFRFCRDDDSNVTPEL